SVQNITLKYALDWLSMRASSAQLLKSTARQVTISRDEVPTPAQDGAPTDPWASLGAWLVRQDKTPDGIRVSFRDLDTLLGGKLPKAARKYATWWSNHSPDNPQCAAWTQAGRSLIRISSTRMSFSSQSRSKCVIKATC